MRLPSTSLTPREQRSTAIHEAAHAVAAIRHGVPIIRASIGLGRDRGHVTTGRVVIGDGATGNEMGFAVIGRCGALAQLTIDCRETVTAGAAIDDGDIARSINAYLASTLPNATERDRAVVHDLVDQYAQRIIDQDGPVIEALAAALVARGELGADEILQIVEHETVRMHPALRIAQRGDRMLCSVATRRLPDQLPMQTRLQPIGASAIDVEARTVQLTFTTGATVRRRKYTGWDTAVPFDETLVVSREAIDLTRLNAGAPVLDSHAGYSTSAQVAVVERAWIEAKEGRASVRFPKAGIDAQADRMFGLVADRIIKNVSTGYSVDEVRIVEAAAKGTVEQHIVQRWTPFEISFVTAGADAGAQVRSADGLATYPVNFGGSGMIGTAAAMRMRMAMKARAACV
ncbi:hypothetical protein [Mesorhizobium cantuariense]|uniref:Uncharacterized protein n=1 Tax=Mesorhizobium cantuariense TaxID=1300275 RepID=A0ABV7MQC6_9HYPH